MTEGEVIEQLVEYTGVLLTGVPVFFTVVSAFIVGLWAFLHRAGFILRVTAFLFFTVTLGVLIWLLLGARTIHEGLIGTLEELDRTTGLSPAGMAAMGNAQGGIDALITQAMLYSAGAFYLSLFLLTFFRGWTRRLDDARDAR